MAPPSALKCLDKLIRYTHGGRHFLPGETIHFTFTESRKVGRSCTVQKVTKNNKSYMKPWWPHFKIELHCSQSLQIPLRFTGDMACRGRLFVGPPATQWPNKPTRYVYGGWHYFISAIFHGSPPIAKQPHVLFHDIKYDLHSHFLQVIW